MAGVTLTGNRPAKAASSSAPDRATPDRAPPDRAPPAMALPLGGEGENHVRKAAARAGAEGGVIEPGRALALADFSPPAVGAGERLIRFAYRLGFSGASLTAPFRKPARPRLLATVESPLAGDRVAGVAAEAGLGLGAFCSQAGA